MKIELVELKSGKGMLQEVMPIEPDTNLREACQDWADHLQIVADNLNEYLDKNPEYGADKTWSEAMTERGISESQYAADIDQA